MHFREAFTQALRTLRAERLRSFLTMFGIVWGTASVVFLMSWGLGVQAMLEAGLARAGKNVVMAWPGKIGEEYTPAGDRRELWFTRADVDGVRRRVRLAEAVVGEGRFWGPIGHGQTTLSTDVRGVEPASMDIHGTAIAAGRAISGADLRQRRRVVVIGERLRRRLLGGSGVVGATVRIRGQSFRVVGVLARVGTQLWRDNGEEIDDQAWIPLTTLFTLDPRPGRDPDVIDRILVRVAQRQDYEALKVELRTALANRLRFSPTDEEAIRMASPIDLLRKLPVDQTTGLLLILGGATLLIGGIGVLTMMLDAVQERRQEIGVRLAVGARRRDVIGQFFLETFVITGLGGLIGLAIGVGGALALANLEVPDLIPVPILRGWIVALAIGVMTFVGLAAGLVPAWRASRVDPSVTLRAE
ncbi:MAG: ABC transporter permease [Candidatus Binatia bacterium]